MNKIAEIRKAHGLTQGELAKLLGIAQNTLSQYETERRSPDTKTIMEIAKHFGVSVNYILGYPETSTTNSTSEPMNITQATKVYATSETDRANLYLSLGWKLLFVGNESYYDEGVNHSITYVLGWFKNPDEPAASPATTSSDERYDYSLD